MKTLGLKREEISVATKVWNTDRGYEKTLAAFEKSIKELDLGYVDLYLIHWPANQKMFGDQAKEINASTWRALEECYQSGRAKAIGVSNFLPHHLEELAATARIKPMVNQIEFHPGWAHLDVVEYCLKNEIIPEAWSPMARSGALSNETLISLAEKYGKTPAQICLRWVLQHGLRRFPRASRPPGWRRIWISTISILRKRTWPLSTPWKTVAEAAITRIRLNCIEKISP